jgi:23S rRNA pseudouridine1911/1915/1917 synthase
MEVCVRIPPPTVTELMPEAIPLDVLYEDSDIIIVNKQAGLVVHPAAGHSSGTLVNALLYHCHDLGGIGGDLRPGIVHRLDKDTSGALVAAKHETALNGLIEQFKAGRVEKEYRALVLGIPTPPSGTIETLIGRSRNDRKKMSAHPPVGRQAVTHYETIRRWVDAALLSVRIETGRTHQIRVHMRHIGHPVLGDSQYGSRQAARMAPRQMLHAFRLAFAHPVSGVPVSVTAAFPDDMIARIGAFTSALDAPSSGTDKPPA